MGLIDEIYTSKYNKILKKINSLNLELEKGYPKLYNYIISDEKMLSYFEELKKIERKFPRLHVDSYETFNKTISNQLNKIYNYLLCQAFNKSENNQKLKELNELKLDIKNCYGHCFDNIVKEIENDINEKINNIDKYKIIKKENLNESKNNDLLYNEALNYTLQNGKINESLLQRKFKIGYNRAVNIINLLEENGIITHDKTAKFREVKKQNEFKLIRLTEEQLEYTKLKEKRENKSNEEIMKEYNIDVEYDKYDVCKLIKNSLVMNSNEDEDKTDFVDKIIKYSRPDEVQLLIIDFDKYNFIKYFGLPHLISPIIKDYQKANISLKNIDLIIESRLDMFVENKVKDFNSYNNLESIKQKNKCIPYILIIINDIYELFKENDSKEILSKILLNCNRVGIKIIAFSKYNKNTLNIGNLENLLRIYSKYNYDQILEGIRINNNVVKDEMSGLEFENYIGEILKDNGFDNVDVTKSSGDFGVDVIAVKDDIKYAIQCKKYSSPVGIKAVQEVLGSKTMNDCHVAVVLTNNTFTKSAIELAEKNNVLLWDGEKLKNLLENYKEK